jgi:hypothetical protein
MMLLPNGPTSEHESGLSRRELVKYGTVAALATVVQPNITVAQSRTVSGIVYERSRMAAASTRAVSISGNWISSPTC